MSNQGYDLVVVGGGINGCGIARDAAGRGLSVLLVEQDDLANATSSASTKLIHGGLRYLEHYEFRLVREALRERERLLEAAPHIIEPLRIVLPHDRSIRPVWMIRIGLFLYDHLAPLKQLQGCETIDFTRHPYGRNLRPEFKVGFAYSDCRVDDSRLVVLTALDAQERGAEIRVRTRLVAGQRRADGWTLTLEDSRTGQTATVGASVVVNAAGPWVADVLKAKLAVATTKSVRMVKGSHIVVPKLYDGDHAYILQNADRRIVFAIPFQGDYSLVGTTDIPYQGDPRQNRISPEEIQYLCTSINHVLRSDLAPSQVVWGFSGVRPLYDDGSIEASVVTRDYVFDLDAPAGHAPALSVFGGKLTTFRRLAEHALEKLAPFFPGLRSAWTETAALPGGDIPPGGFPAFLASLQAQRPFLDQATAYRLARAYGTRVDRVLGPARSMSDLGRNFGGGLTEHEIDYLIDHEFATSAEDVLWRRSKVGLRLPDQAAKDVADYIQGRLQTRQEMPDSARV